MQVFIMDVVNVEVANFMVKLVHFYVDLEH